MKVLVIAGGELKNSEIINKKIQDNIYDLTIAVDSGYDNAKKLNITPHIVIGDLDSVQELDFNGKIIKYNPEKDETDLMLACEYEKNAKFIDIICATGNRLDHFMVNLSILEQLYTKGVQSRIIDEKNIISVLKGKKNYVNVSKYISILPITNEIEMSCSNLKYNADKLIVKREKIISVSNEAISNEFQIDISKGEAFIIQSDD